MKISTKGRYALRIMLDLAQHRDGGYISLKDIADRQRVSMKYLESIAARLNKAGLVDSLRGKNGGYRLNRSDSAYTTGEILKLMEGSLAPAPCLERGGCERAAECLTLPLWKKLDDMIDNYLESVTLEDLLTGRLAEKGDSPHNSY